jgi:hypothetical protein
MATDRLVGPLPGMLFARAVVAGIDQITPRMRLIRLATPLGAGKPFGAAGKRGLE